MRFPSVSAKAALPVSNEFYPKFLNTQISRAKRRIWASIFIIDPRPENDIDLRVRGVLDALEGARARGLDIRVLIGTSGVMDIRLANAAALHMLHARGIDARWYVPTQGKSSLHSKYVICDSELVLLGGHNWSTGAFGNFVQDSVAIESKDLNHLMSVEFNALWTATQETASYEN